MKTIVFINGKDVNLDLYTVVEKNPNGTYFVGVNITSPTYPLAMGSSYFNETKDPHGDLKRHGLEQKAIEAFKQDLERSVMYYSREVENMKALLITEGR